MKRICKEALQKGSYHIFCPKCDLQLSLTFVRHILASVMTQNELNELLDWMSENFLHRPDSDIRACLVCGVNWKRDFTKRWPGHRNRVVCNTCSKNRGRQVEYCWECRREWTGGSYKCGHPDCNWEEEQLTTLRNCDTKTIGQVAGCPIIRACPRCGILLHHETRCKHMTCKCGCNFCFVCLKKKKRYRNWECTPFDPSCRITARQTSLPTPEIVPVQHNHNFFYEIGRNYFNWIRRLFRR